MKELSIEDKAKAYDNIIKKANKMHRENCEACQMCIEEHIPELGESEDEKIRKAIYSCVKWFGFDSCFFKDVSQEECLAYIVEQGEQKLDGTFVNVDDVREAFINEVYRVLDADPNNDRANQIIDAFDNLPTVTIEKQGEKGINGKNRGIPFAEQKPADVEPKFKAGDKIISTISNIPYYITEVCNGHYLTDVGCIIMFNAQDNFELVEQNPAWSEEDEKYLIYNIEQDYRDKLNNNPPESLRPYYNKVISLLKSIRHQKQWKPSDKQLEALEHAINCYSGISPTNTEEVYTLEIMKEQLKKLREG